MALALTRITRIRVGDIVTPKKLSFILSGWIMKLIIVLVTLPT